MFSYYINTSETSLTIYAGPLADLDFNGVLEKTVIKNLSENILSVKIVLDGVHFLHETLAIGLIRIGRILRERGGSLTLVDAPWFIKTMLRTLQLEHLFCFSTSDSEEILFLANSYNSKELLDETIALIRSSNSDDRIF